MSLTDTAKAPTDGSVNPYCCFLPDGSEAEYATAAPGPNRLAIGCAIPAEFVLIFGPNPRPDDYTHACRDHVGALILDHTETRVIPVDAW